jgi:exosortase/archaeosortase family protein
LNIGLWLLPVCWLWFRLIDHLRVEWSVNPQYGYGWAVPFLCAYLLWQSLRTGAERSPPGISSPRRLHTSASGIPIFKLPTLIFYLPFMFGALLYAPTRLIEEANPEWRLVSWALAVEVVGLTLLFAYALEGVRGQLDSWRSEPGESRTELPPSNFNLRSAAFAICFFMVAVPWPTVIEGPLIQTLTRANASATVELMQLAGIPAVQRGNVIEIATGIVGIDEACSGIRSFQAALMISLFLGGLYRLNVSLRIGLVVAGFVMSFVFNVGRTTLLVWVASRQGVAAISTWHDPAGVVILLCCFFGLWVLAVWLRKPGLGDGRRKMEDGSQQAVEPRNIEHPTSNIQHPSPSGSESAETGSARGSRAQSGVPPDCSPHPKAEVRPLTSDLQSPASAVNAPRFVLHPSSLRLRRVALTLAVWLLVVEASVEWWYRSHETRLARSAVWTVDLPGQNLAFRKLPMTEAAKRILRYDEAVNAAWEEQGRGFQVIFLRWNPGRTALHLAKGHTPEVCLTAAGRRLASGSDLAWFDVHGLRMPFRSYAVTDEGQPLHVFYCLWDDLAGEQSFETTSLGYWNRLEPVLAGRRNPGQRSIEIAVWGIADAAAAETAVRKELEKLVVVK